MRMMELPLLVFARVSRNDCHPGRGINPVEVDTEHTLEYTVIEYRLRCTGRCDFPVPHRHDAIAGAKRERYVVQRQYDPDPGSGLSPQDREQFELIAGIE